MLLYDLHFSLLDDCGATSSPVAAPAHQLNIYDDEPVVYVWPHYLENCL